MSDEPRLLEPELFEDERGTVFESYNQVSFDDLIGRPVRFVQDNHSTSVRGVLRGLHYQLPPASQGKLVRVVTGTVFDVVVDIRRSSPGFGRWAGHEISASNRKQLWVPPGFAHAFLVLSAVADVVYKLTSFHEPELGRTIRWDDPEIGIGWPLDGAPILSTRDSTAPGLAEAEVFG